MGRLLLILSLPLVLCTAGSVLADNLDPPDLDTWVRPPTRTAGANPFAGRAVTADGGSLLPTAGGGSEEPSRELGDFIPGTRFRVTVATGDDRPVGTLASIDHEQLVLDTPDHGKVTFPLGEVSRLEMSRGTNSRWKAGAIVGAVGGPAVACAVTRPCLGPGTVVLAVLTGAVGAWIGKSFKTERWEAVDVPVAVRVSVAAAPAGGVSALVSVSF